jgi:hypothetical protein
MIPQKWLSELSELHRNYIGAVERAEWTPSIVAADRLARSLGTTLSEMLAEVEREERRLRRLEETLSGDRGPKPVARISNPPWSGRCLPVKRGAGFRRGAFVGWFHGTSPNPSSGPVSFTYESTSAMDTRNQPSHDSSTLGPQGPSRAV